SLLASSLISDSSNLNPRSTTLLYSFYFRSISYALLKLGLFRVYNCRTSNTVTDADLKFLMDEILNQNHKWEDVIDKTNHHLCYKSKSTKPKNGPLKYWSMTVFNDISAEMLRNFYMDNHYRNQWDNTVVEHNQLQLDESDGSEVGREGVTHLKPGDKALPVFTGECGECPHCKSEESNMCDLLRINTDRGVMLNDNKSRFSINGEPINHFVGTSTFSEYTVVHAGCVAKINPEVYNVGQVVKCRVVSSIPASRRINLSLIIKPTRVSEDDMVTLGSIVSGIVDRVTSNAVVVYIDSSGFSRGTISMEHLADHHGQATLMKSVLKPGYNFDKLLVLDFKGNNMILSAKSSLIKYAQQIPSEISQMHPNSVVHGYICNLIETGCFVRFLGQLTGFSPRNKAADDQKTNILEAYFIGQSVRCNVSNISGETGRVTVSLKQTSCSSADASFINEYFLMDEKIAKLQYKSPSESDLKWDEKFNIGTLTEGRVEEIKDVGIVVCFEKYNDVFGFITNYQLGGTVVEKGSLVEAFVLDFAKAERLVDLTLKPEFINISRERSSMSHTKKKKRQRDALKGLVLHQTVNAVVEIVKENYLVVSIPENNYTLGYAQLSYYNTQRFPRKQYLNGQSVVASVMALPSLETSGRLLLHLNEVNRTSSSKRTKKSSYKVGSLVEAEITDIKTFELKLKFGFGLHGRVHITEVHDANDLENPFSGYKIGQTVTARIVSKPNDADSSRNGSRWELSVRPEMVTGSSDIGDNISEKLDFKIGQCVAGYIYKVESEWVWLAVSRNVKAQLHILDSSTEPNELEDFQNRYHVGRLVSGHVLSFNLEKKLLRLVLRPFSTLPLRTGEEPQTNLVNKELTAHIREGDILGGRISKILPGVGGLLVQIGPHTYGKVHFTELTEKWVPDPLSVYHEGQFVKSVVLEVSNTVRGTVQEAV
ncbi:hypothetical protein RYX36_021651, partial [Vicia faba]